MTRALLLLLATLWATAPALPQAPTVNCGALGSVEGEVLLLDHGLKLSLSPEPAECLQALDVLEQAARERSHKFSTEEALPWIRLADAIRQSRAHLGRAATAADPGPALRKPLLVKPIPDLDEPPSVERMNRVYFHGTPYAFALVVATTQDGEFATWVRTLYWLACRADRSVLGKAVDQAVYLSERGTFILTKGFLRYPWEDLFLPAKPGDSGRGVLLHPEVALTLGPLANRSFRELREMARTSLRPTLNVAVLGWVAYPRGTGSAGDRAYETYCGLALGVMNGPATSSRPSWGPSLMAMYKRYTLGVSRHATDAGPRETYLFTTFSLRSLGVQ